MSHGHKVRQAPRSALLLRRGLITFVAAGAVVLGIVFINNPDDGRSPDAVASPGPSSAGNLQTIPESAPTEAATSAAEGTESEEEETDAAPSTDPGFLTGPGAKSGDAGMEPGPNVAGDAQLATQDLSVADPVEISAGSSNNAGIDIRVTEMEAVDGEAQGIGEVAGPAVRFTLNVINNSGKPIDLANAVMTVDAGADNLPCTQLSGPEAAPLPPAAEPGQTVTGSYVFLIPVEDRNLVTVYLSYSVDAPVAAFKGAVPTP